MALMNLDLTDDEKLALAAQLERETRTRSDWVAGAALNGEARGPSPRSSGRDEAAATGVKAYTGPAMTLGGAAAAQVRLVVWCKACQYLARARPRRDGRALRRRDHCS
jgi:hypothetical protein